ncbi:MAG: tetratricopeptide repeat protein [Bacteroidales bacterium]|nr:tetratricopeptide repeat protein [Bacteroidales bacterium]
MKIYNYSLFLGSCLTLMSLVGMTNRAESQDLQEALRLSQSERYEDADALYKKIIKANPSNSEAYFYYGENMLLSYIADPYSNSLNDVGNESNKQFNLGISADSLNPLNHIGKGMVVLLLKNDTTAADVYFNRAESLLPKKVKKYTERDVVTLIKLGEAQLYAKEPRFKKALGYMESAKVADPNNTDIYVSTGVIYETQGDHSAAVANYNKAVYINPKLVVPLVKIGNLYMRSKNLEGARANFEKAKEIDSTYAPTYRCFGEMYSLAGLDNLSILSYRKFLELSGNNIPAKTQYLISLFKAGKYTETLSVAEEILNYDTSRNYLNRIAAYSCFDKRPTDYEKARIYIETFFKNTTPEKIIVKDYLYYGRILLKLKDTALVDRAFDELVKGYLMDTTDMNLVEDIALNAYVYKKYDIAIEMLNKKMNNKTADVKDYMNLGKAYYQSKQYDKALGAFDKVLSREPDNMQAYTWKASTYTAMDPDSKEGLAKPIYETIIRKGSENPDKYKNELYTAYSYLGSYYLFTIKPADYDKAENYYEKLISLDPDNNNWIIKGYTSLGIIYYQKKSYVQAKKYYNEVLKIDPQNQNALKTIEGLNRILDQIEVQRQLNE